MRRMLPQRLAGRPRRIHSPCLAAAAMPGDAPFAFSEVPGDPSFRGAAVNCVALVPLLSSDRTGAETDTRSVRSFRQLCAALQGARGGEDGTAEAPSSAGKDVDILLVVPNSSLTRPGEWRYRDTPLKSFHWQHGCQRLRLFDGRPQESRLAHDRLMNHSVTRDWIDLAPARRTAAVVGVLNLRDCAGGQADLRRAQEELAQWAARYAAPPYEATAHGRGTARDRPVERLFVFDSFDEEAARNLDLTQLSTPVLAFPPLDNAPMMDMHLNEVVNDLAVSIFCDLEAKIQASDAISERFAVKAPKTGIKGSLSKMLQGDKAGGNNNKEADAPTQPTRVSLGDMAAFVSPKSKLAREATRSRGVSRNASFASDIRDTLAQQPADAAPKLLTPLDRFHDPKDLSPRDLEDLTRRDLARREKYAADLALLGGSPLDAYERYLRAADLCRAGTPDPLWYAAALEGCAAAHIAMAEAGGFGVDEYLSSFQMPDEIMSLAKEPAPGSASKQTLPEVVFALCDEALNILNRHEQLAPLHAELLLKLADYVANAAEMHLRCRWGEGPGCYGGEMGDVPRWERTAVFKTSFAEPKAKGGGGDLIHINTFNRTKQVCELLQEAVSVGSLNPTTRVDVAARCARLCLDGVKATQWEGRSSEPVRLPRKAALFAVMAAETMAGNSSARTAATTRDLWLLASRLYSKDENSLTDGGSYGWAILRATVLDALSMQGNHALANEAAKELLVLLSEIEPKISKTTSKPTKEAPKSTPVLSPLRRARELTGRQDKKVALSDAADSKSVDQSLDDAEEESERNVITVGTIAKQLRASFASITPNSTIIAVESKWADGPVITPVDVPFAPTSRTASTVKNIGCVWLNAAYDHCSAAQEECMKRIQFLRRSLSTSSNIEAQDSSNRDGSLPVYVSSEMSILNEGDVELERVKTKTTVEKDNSAMATFFNPYEKAKNDRLVIVAEEEERFMVIKFGNRLSIPLEVQRCKLVFADNADGRAKASALSFMMPPKVNNFVIHFPFSVLVDPSRPDDASDTRVFEVLGIELTFLGRVYFIPVFSSSTELQKTFKFRGIPLPGSVYSILSAPQNTAVSKEISKPRFETCSSQPRLQILFLNSGAPVESIATLSISLADGEKFTLPSLQLKNYAGPGLLGNIERLQIIVADIPGLSETKLFDSEGVDPQIEDAFLKQQVDEESSVPIRLNILTSALSLRGINSGKAAESIATFQIAAANNMKKLIPDGTTFRLRFRYRGRAELDSEVWRKLEITYHVACVNGPRLSSMDFRANLSSDSAHVEMCKCFKERHRLNDDDLQSVSDVTGETRRKPVPHNNIFRVGLDNGIHVANKDVVFLLTIANETKSEIILSRDNEPVGGFRSYPMETVLVHSGVSAKVPVVLPRLSRMNTDGSTINLTQEIISRTKLTWSTESTGDAGEIATGQLQIPRGSLQEIIDQHPAFIQKICEAPCDIRLRVGGADAARNPTTVVLGRPINISAAMKVAAWVPAEVSVACSVQLEFFCVRSDKSGPAQFDKRSQNHVWIGKLLRKFRMDESDTAHQARLVLTSSGRYFVSACARISHDDAAKDVEEVWWAPVAACLVVDQNHVPQ